MTNTPHMLQDGFRVSTLQPSNLKQEATHDQLRLVVKSMLCNSMQFGCALSGSRLPLNPQYSGNV